MRILALILISFSLLASCVQTGRIPTDMPEAVKRAATLCDHEALVKHYEEAAKEMQAKIKEHRKILKSYESVPSHSEDEASMLRSYYASLIGAYEQAVKANLDMANFHRSIAKEVK